MNQCTRCRSYAINHHSHGRDGSDKDLCDVCYWRKRAEAVLSAPPVGEPVAWQWRKKGQPWTLEKTFNTEVFATTDDSEVRALYAIAQAMPAAQGEQP